MVGGALMTAVHGVADTTERLHFHFSLSCTGEGNGSLLQCSCLENPATGEPGGLPSLGSHRVGHDWSDLAAAVADNVVKIFFCLRKNLLLLCGKSRKQSWELGNSVNHYISNLGLWECMLQVVWTLFAWVTSECLQCPAQNLTHDSHSLNTVVRILDCFR